MSDWLNGVKVPSLTIAAIREVTDEVREVTGALPGRKYPVLELLEHNLLLGLDGYDFEIVESLPNDEEARTFPDGCKDNPEGPFIQIKQSVYNDAYNGDGRARFTIAHEIGHVFLHAKVAVLNRGPRGAELNAFENSEWQANTFAGELLMPPESFTEYQTLEEYCWRMQVSYSAALIQGRKLMKRQEIGCIDWLL